MKNSKNFDYDKKRPSLAKKYIIQTESDPNQEDYNKLFNEPPLIKGFENTKSQITNKSIKTSKSVSKTSVASKNKTKIKLNTKNKSNPKDKESNITETELKNNDNSKNSIGIQSGQDEEKEKEKEQENIGIIIPSLPDTEIIEPEEPLPEEGKVPNPSFCKNYVSNLLNPAKAEIDPINWSWNWVK